MKYVLVNNFAQTLSSAILAADTQMTLNGGGDRLTDVVNGSVHALLTLVELNADNEEIGWEVVEVTDVVGNDLTIVRDGATSKDWSAGVPVELRVNETMLKAFAFTDDLPAPVDASTFISVTDNAWLGYPAEAGVGTFGLVDPARSVLLGASSLNDLGFRTNHTVDLATDYVAIRAGDFGWHGDSSVFLGIGGEVSDFGVTVGRFCLGDGPGAVSIGNVTYADSGSVSMGVGGYAYGGAVSIVTTTPDWANLYGDSNNWGQWDVEGNGAQGDMSVAMGWGAYTIGNYSASIGAMARAEADGGLRITSVPYIAPPLVQPQFSTIMLPTEGGMTAQPDYTKHVATPFVMALPPLNLSDAVGTAVDLQFSVDLVMFIDEVEFVVRQAGDIAGTPAISLGTSDVNPADLLAATTISDLTQYSRQKEAVLVDNGVTNVRAEITTAGTGLEGEFYVVVRGYAFEAA